MPNSTLYHTRSAYLLPGTTPTSYLPYLSLSGTSQAAPVVTGTIALMLQANPALTPNAVKAALQFTAQIQADYDPLTEGAGFLNAQGAVDLAHYLAAPSVTPYPADTIWSRQLLWGNHRVDGGRLAPDASAWQPGTLWGGTKSSSGQPIAWGVICSSDCADGPGVWDWWGVSCADSSCSSADWSGSDTECVVWGSQCGGSDCPCGGTSGGPPGSVWGTTVVWGTSDDGFTVVWGTSCSDPSCEPVIWRNPYVQDGDHACAVRQARVASAAAHARL